MTHKMRSPHWMINHFVTRLVIICLLITAGTNACRSDPGPKPTNEVSRDGGLELMLELDRDVYKLGQTIQAKVILRNAGSEPVLVNARLAWNREAAPFPFREITFQWTRSSGANPNFALIVDRGFPKDDDFIQLAPNATVERTFDITFYFEIEETGGYSLQAIYENQSEPEDGREVWKGELKSNLISFTVEP